MTTIFEPPGLRPGDIAGTPWPVPGPTTMRVLSWNLHNMLGDVLAIHRVIAGARPDVVCLQEANRWLGSRHLIASMARATGLFFVVGGRRSAGTALLVSARTRVAEPQAVPLSTTARRWEPDVEALWPRPQGVVRARVGLTAGPMLRVVSAHNPWQPEMEGKHLDAITTWPDGTPAQVIGGDFNRDPGSPSWDRLTRDVRDPGPDTYLTFPSDRADHRIDAVLVDPTYPVSRYGWPSSATEGDVCRATDHRPVCADLELG